jgi:prephenate dehydrogenase
MASRRSIPPATVCVLGVGLIGGSLGLALRKHGRKKYSVTGLGRNARKLRAAQRLGAVDRFETDLRRGVQDADIVVLCVPVHRIAPQLSKVARFLKPGAIVTDVGSVKKNVIAAAHKALRARPDVSFVGAHPIAGSERTGVENASATLFQNATCALTTDGARSAALKTVRALWTDIGARCLTMTAARHDHWLALTSHLPHLFAFALFQCVSDAAKKNQAVKALRGGSFRDMTRIAGADPELWAGVVETNRREIQHGVRAACQQLSRMGRAPLAKLVPLLGRLQRAKQSWPTR